MRVGRNRATANAREYFMVGGGRQGLRYSGVRAYFSFRTICTVAQSTGGQLK
jgi:hypothetical protein